MKTLTTRFPSLFGITLLAVVMVFSFASCKQDVDEDDDDPVIPSVLQSTEWSHTSGDSIAFDNYNSVTITPSGKQAQKFTLKKINNVKEINQTTLFFSDEETKDHIVYRGDAITMVNFSIIDQLNRANGWGKGGNPTTPIEYFNYIAYYESSKYVEITGYTSYGGDDRSVVIIPEKINGLSVTRIKSYAFNNKQLTSVTIPSSVTTIGESAFTNNQQLASITIKGAYVTLGNYSSPAFDNNFDTYYQSNGAGIYTYANGSWSKKNLPLP